MKCSDGSSVRGGELRVVVTIRQSISRLSLSSIQHIGHATSCVGNQCLHKTLNMSYRIVQLEFKSSGYLAAKADAVIKILLWSICFVHFHSALPDHRTTCVMSTHRQSLHEVAEVHLGPNFILTYPCWHLRCPVGGGCDYCAATLAQYPPDPQEFHKYRNKQQIPTSRKRNSLRGGWAVLPEMRRPLPNLAQPCWRRHDPIALITYLTLTLLAILTFSFTQVR